MAKMMYINSIFVHYNHEDKTWASELTWDSVQKNEERKAQGKIRGDFTGIIETQYFEESLLVAVESVYQLAKSFGISEDSPLGTPRIFYTENDELLRDFPCNKELEALIEAENNRRGWGA